MKFHGKIGFYEDNVEIAPSVYRSQIKEVPYVGDIVQDNRRYGNNGMLNDEFKINNRIRIIADMYMQEHWASIRYVIWKNQKLKVTNVTVDYPAIFIDLGGEWHDERTSGT